MLSETLKKLISLTVKGLSNAQLLARIRHVGVAISPDEILHALVELQKSGEIVLASGNRWALAQPEEAKAASLEPRVTGRLGHAQSVLHAIGLNYSEISSLADITVLPVAPGHDRDLTPWSDLVGYYESTQRLDPRGQIEQFPDRHGIQFQLVSTTGSWWRNAELSVDEDRLPAAFREALAKRGNESLALGYGTSVVDIRDVTTIMPALLLPATAVFRTGALVLQLTSDRPILNPKWLAIAAKRSSYSVEDLKDRLLPEDENDLGRIVELFRNVLATQIIGGLQPARLSSSLMLDREGITNTLGLYLPDDSSFTRGTANDLAAMRGWEKGIRTQTAASSLIEGTEERDGIGTAELLNPLPMTANQAAAAELALRHKLTTIQGPPGTGKSQVIVSLLCSAILQGKSVLLASRNHQAIDEVESRLFDLCSGQNLMVRTRDSEGDRDVSFLQALRDIANSRVTFSQSAGFEKVLADLMGKAIERRINGAVALDHEATSLQLAELLSRRAAIEAKLGGEALPAESLWQRIVRKLFKRGKKTGEPGFDHLELARAIEGCITKLAATKLAPLPTEAQENEFISSVVQALPEAISSILSVSQQQWNLADHTIKALDFDRVKTVGRIAEGEARMIIAKRPIWASTTLSVPKRIPLVPALFDYVIFDEASQCDIASALPLLARAKAAIIVGDPEQLSFIPSLSLHQENALMDAAKLPKAGRHMIAQSINSLFDFATRQPCCRAVMLCDQFRSAPGIVGYLNDVFYNGKLLARRRDGDLKTPKAYRPGLHWEDVIGQIRVSPDGGADNPAEAEAIVKKISELDREGFDGTIGVISPFNAQIGLLRTKIQSVFSKKKDLLGRIKIATVDSFQGGEADLILFSVVAGPGAPQSLSNFLKKDRRRFNVAVSRARAVCIVFGNLSFSKTTTISHLRILADRATAAPSATSDGFDSHWERIVDAALRKRGLEPFPQYQVGLRRLDFALFNTGNNIKLDLEVDGRKWHVDTEGLRKKSDLYRDLEMQARGWKVRRFWVHELEHNLEACLDAVERDLGR